MAVAIGIDLGTTYSCAAIYRHGQVEIIPNRNGKLTTPSYVAFTETQRLIGESAKQQAVMNSKNTIFDAKRLIGRKYDDPSVQNDISHWPFKVINDDNTPNIEVNYRHQIKRHTAIEISSYILSEMKAIAESYLNSKVCEVVITVPAYFNDSQRQATKDAGAIAGLNVMRIINEPTAAAMAYGLENQKTCSQTILVFDLGGGTFDVSILVIEDGIFEVKSTAGDTHLGGEDFNNRLLEHLLKEIKENHGVDLSTNQRALVRLRNECETVKQNLSITEEDCIEVEALFDAINFATKITRVQFEKMNADLFAQTLESVKKALADAQMDKMSIDDVILVGGSTRIPKIQQLLRDFFDGKVLKRQINPDEAVARGAAIQAKILSTDSCEELEEIVLLDVTPLSLGIQTEGGMMSTIIGRNTPIPTRNTKTFTTTKDMQTEISIQVYEGERPLVKHNNLLGTFILDNIKPQPRQVPSIAVTFEINSEGILTVRALEERADDGNNNEKVLTIRNDQGRLTRSELDRMIQEAKLYQENGEQEKERVDAQLALEELCLGMTSRVKFGNARQYEDEMKNRILNECEAVLEWLDLNPNETKATYAEKSALLRTKIGQHFA